ncbi:MAG TPA: hypothetical protein VFP69_13355 [Streptomyces sp.]|nr:hypothetical protein [Streptomyces sp.]
MRVRVRAMAGVTLLASMALVACDPEVPDEYTGAEPSGATAVAAARFAPLVRLHEKESLMPMDASHFAGRSALRYDHDGLCRGEEPVADPADPGRLGRKAAADAYRHHDVGPGKQSSTPVSCPGHGERERVTTDKDARFYLDPPKEVRVGEGTGAPVYWEHHKHRSDPERTAYVYWFFYAYNKLVPGNRHEGDWERVAVQLRDGRPDAVTFAKHGSSPCSVPWGDMKVSDGHPTVYSALGSHGSYPTGGYHRVSATFDRTSDRGAEWRTWDDARPLDREPWWGYAGRWGAQPHVDGFNGPAGPYPERRLPGIFTDKPCKGGGKPPADPATPPPPATHTTQGAIRRYEEYLHAVGREDLDTACEIAGPAAKQAEDEGFGPCRVTFPLMFTMISPTQKQALRGATVDPRRIQVHTRDKIEMPVESVRASVTFTERELGDSTLEYVNGDWYITD